LDFATFTINVHHMASVDLTT